MEVQAKAEPAAAPDLLWKNGHFGQTSRRDTWWLSPLLVFLGLGTFCSTAIEPPGRTKATPTVNTFLRSIPLKSSGDSPHAWLGPNMGVVELK